MIRFLLLVSFLVVCPTVQADSITIATRWKGETLDYSFGKHPFSWIVRSAVLPGIARERSGYSPGGIRYSLALADSMKMESDFSSWFFRLGKDQRFTSGAPVTYEDVLYSIKRCQQRGMLKNIESVKPYRTEEVSHGYWVEINLNSNGGLDADFPKNLSDCPILQSDISHLFDRDNGKGTAVVGAGSHAVTEFDLRRKQLVLSGIYRSRSRVQSPNKILLRGVASDREGLTALRVGTVDMLVYKDPEVRSLVLADDTLRTSECDTYLLAYRKDLKVACDPLIDFNLLSYGR